jgi:hypothetical protein
MSLGDVIPEEERPTHANLGIAGIPWNKRASAKDVEAHYPNGIHNQPRNLRMSRLHVLQIDPLPAHGSHPASRGIHR